jgi:hypothetical protein
MEATLILLLKMDQLFVNQRNRILDEEQDNCGFCAFINSRKESINKIIAKIREITKCEPNDIIMIAGEICGSNIQKNVAIAELPKMFVIFDIKINDKWVDFSLFSDIKDEDNNIYNILRAPTYELMVDTQDLQKTFKELNELTVQVNNQCPFAKTFGIDGIGEGLVFKCKDIRTSRLWFKVKGDDHCGKSCKPKVLKNTKMDSPLSKELYDFIEMTVTDARLNQGIEYLNEMQLDIIPKNTSAFIKWIADDIFDEEIDKINELDIIESVIKREICKEASLWYKTQL